MKYYSVIVSGICFLYATASANILIPEFCERINERTYFISRLERIITILHHISQGAERPSLSLDTQQFQHQEIKEVAHAIVKTQSLASLFTAWSRIKEYKNINDDSLMKDFAKLILALPSQFKRSHDTLSDIKDYDIYFSLEGITYTEALTLRLYYVYRLKKCLSYLQRITCKGNDFLENKQLGCDCALISTYTFSHSDIKACIKKMTDDSTLAPLIQLADEFAKLKRIHDNEFQKEFMILIFTLYRNLIVNNAPKYNYTLKKSTVEAIASLYDSLDKLSLEEILDAIDMLTEELAPLLEKYEFTSNMTWKEWLKKYWWGAPVIVGAIGMRIFYWYQQRKNNIVTPPVVP